VRGNALVYEWCAAHGVAHRKTGKWIVGSAAEDEGLEALLATAKASGARGVRRATKAELERDTPGVRADVALFSAETGIVDAYDFSRSLQIAAEEKGAQFLLETAVTAIERLPRGGYRIESSRGEIGAERVVNAAGLNSDEIARMVGITRYMIHPWRGDYFNWRAPRKYERLVYPVKKKGAAGLGVHLTIGLDGSYRLGPDVTHSKRKDDFGPPADVEAKKRAFFEAARVYLEGIALDQLEYDSCGIRPKLRAPGDTEEKDFVFSEDLPGFVSLVGIESPGLTAALDLAERVAAL
jgi:L-2-hydroxyglutarate oxidase LhgO